MAGNNITISAQYNPFTFDQMLAAVNIADQQHKQMEEQMAALASEASIWESLANNEQDRDAYNQYKAYANDLDAQVQELSRSGLNPRSRQAFNQMRTRYGSEIAPITNAYQTRQKWIEEQREYAAKLGGNARFSVDAENIGLGQLIRDPSMTYKAWSGDAIAKATADMAQTFQNEIRDPNSKYSTILNGIFGPARYQRLIQNGLSMDDVVNTLKGSEQGNAILNDMINSSLNQFGYNDVSDQGIRDWMYENAGRGAYQAVGKTSIDAINNPDYGWRQDVDLINRRAAASGVGRQPQSSRLPYSVRDMTTVDKSKKTTKLNSEADVIRDARATLSAGNIDQFRAQLGDKGLFSGHEEGWTQAPYTGTANPAAYRYAETQGNTPFKYGVNKALKEAGININLETASQTELNEAFDRAEKYYNDEIASSVIYDHMYSLDQTANSGLASVLQEQWGMSPDDSNLPFVVIQDGKEMNDKKTREFFEKNEFDFNKGTGNAHFRIEDGLTWATVINGKPAKVRITDPSILNNVIDPNISALRNSMNQIYSVGDFSQLNEVIKEAAKNKDPMIYVVEEYDPETEQYHPVEREGSLAQAYIDMFMTGLYNRGVRTQVQGNTSSNAGQIQQNQPTFINSYGR